MLEVIRQAAERFLFRQYYPAVQVQIGFVDQDHIDPNFDKSYFGRAQTLDGKDVHVHVLNWRNVVQDNRGRWTLSKANSHSIHPGFRDQERIVMVCTESNGATYAVAWCTFTDWRDAGASIESLIVN